MARRPVSPEETSSPVTLSEARGLDMSPHNHRDASLALSVTSTMFLRSAAKNPGRDASLALSVTSTMFLRSAAKNPGRDASLRSA